MNTQTIRMAALVLAAGLSSGAQAVTISYGDVTASNGFGRSQLLKTVQGVFSE